jgi:hypothetical protein
VSGSCALPPRWPTQCSCVVIESSFDPGERLQAPGSLWLRYVLEYVLEVHEYFTLYGFQFNLCFILVLGYFCMNIFKMFLEYFWNIFKICFGICFKNK